MDNQKVQKIKDAISKSKSIGIAVGRNPSVDQMAAALSLYLLLQEANRHAVVVCPSDPIVELSSLVGIDRVQKQLGGDAGDLIVSFPYLEGEIEKVSYTLENGYLNIIVKAAEQGLSFTERDVNYTRGSGAVDLLFVIGTQSLADLEGIFDSQKAQNTQIINIDNDDRNQKFGDLVLVSPRFSSVSEQVADVALSVGFNVDHDAAQNLLMGITAATDNFQDPRTTALAFEVSAYLMKKGAQRITEVAGQRDNNFAAQFANRQPAPQQPPVQNRPAQAPAQPQPRPQPQPQNTQQLSDDRREQLRQQLREQEAQQRATQQQNNQPQDQNDDNPPVDWLEPKVYKGSSNF